MKIESKINIIKYCYIIYGAFVMFGAMANIVKEVGGPIWGTFAQGFAFWLIAIAIHRKAKGSWWFIFLSSAYVVVGSIVGFAKILPESISSPQIFYSTLILMIIPLVLIFTPDLKKALNN